MMHVALTVHGRLTLLASRVCTFSRVVRSSVIAWAKIPALSIVGVSIAQLVAFALLMLGGHARPYVGNNAEKIYLPAASHILTTGSFDDPNTYAYSTEAPGYPVFLAVLQTISTEYYLPLTVCLQMLLNCCIALLLLLLGNRMTSRGAGWLAAVLWLFFPPAVVISTWITAETLFTALLLLGMVLWIHNLSRHGPAAFSFISGLIIGVATLVRASIQFLPIFLFAMVLFRGFSRYLPKCALLLLGAFLVIFPWTLRNLYVLGEPIIVQTGFGAVFLQGSRSEYFTIDGEVQGYPVLRRQAEQEGFVKPKDHNPVSLDHWRFNLGLRNYRLRFRLHPFSFIPFVLHKFLRLWYGAETGTFYKQLILGISSVLVVPLGFYQIWRWRRANPLLSRVFFLLVAYFVGLHIVGYPEFRYIVPICPFLLFSASHPIYTLYSRFISRSRADIFQVLQRRIGNAG